jgi:hypothetical protein
MQIRLADELQPPLLGEPTFISFNGVHSFRAEPVSVEDGFD